MVSRDYSALAQEKGAGGSDQQREDHHYQQRDTPDYVLPIPSSISFWRPTSPFLERRIPHHGPLALLYRFLRISYALLTLPLWIILVLLSYLPYTLSHPARSVIRRNTRDGWTLVQKIGYPTAARLGWAITYGRAPEISAWADALFAWVGGWTWGNLRMGKRVRVRPVEIQTPSVGSRYGEDEKGTAPCRGETLDRRWYEGEATDPDGLVQPKNVGAFWVWREDQERKEAGMGWMNADDVRPERENERVVMYLFGGGYVTGHPLVAPAPYDISRLTGLRVLGVNYRRAISDDRAFPAQLQDAITAYVYLRRQGFRDIVLAGDSAGAGLAMSLLLYFASRADASEPKTLSARPAKLRNPLPQDFVFPTALVLHSPWADLTMSSPSIVDNEPYDFLTLTTIGTAVTYYLRTGHSRPNLLFPSRDLPYSPTPAASKRHKTSSLRVPAHSRHSPLVSPSLSSSLSALCHLGSISARVQTPIRFFISYGSSEIFRDETRDYVTNLKQAGLDVTVVEGKDEIHTYAMFPEWISKEGARTRGEVKRFLGGDVDDNYMDRS